MKQFHWLPVSQRIFFSIITNNLLTYTALNGLAPAYIKDLLKPYVPTRTLQSSINRDLLEVPSINSITYGQSLSLLYHLISRTHFQSIDRFQSRGQELCILLGIKESFNMSKEFDSHRIFFVHKHGRRSIVLYTNMAAVTSCENDLYSRKCLIIRV